jgi:membrane dipeptidase
MNKPSIKSTATLFIKSFLVLMILTLCFFFFIGTAIIEKKANAVIQSPPYKASQKAIELHKTLQAADLHADSLLWGRRLTC